MKTQRTYTDVETGILFSLYQEKETHKFSLIYDGEDESTMTKGTTVNGWYISEIPVMIKLNTKKEIKLDGNSFYNLKEDEVITHKKFIGFDKKYKRV